MSSNLTAAFAGASSANNESTIDTMMAMMDEDDCAEMWTESAAFSSNAAAASSSLHQGLKTMEELMRCTICSELMKIPVSILPCHHTFCKTCFVDYAKASMSSMKRKVNCPLCRSEVPVTDKHHLVPNATLEQLILTFKEQVRQPLKQTLSVAATATTTTAATVSQSAESGSSSNNGANQEQQLTPVPATRGRKRTRQDYAEMDNGDDADEEDGDDYQGNDDDDCVVVLQHVENNQLTNAQPSRAVAASSFQQAGLKVRKKKNKTSYHSMKLKQLRELCQKEGLPDNGTQAELKARHEAFVSLYNAECDSTRPRSVPDLVKAILQEERNQKSYAMKTAKDSKCMEALKKHREQLGKEAEAAAAATGDGQVDTGVLAKSGNTAFDTKMKINYQNMIETLKAREKKKPRRTGPRSYPDDGTTATDAGTDTDTAVDDSKGDTAPSEPPDGADGLAAADDNAGDNQPSTPATLPARNPYRKSPRSATSRGSNASPHNMPLNRNHNDMATPAAAACTPKLSQPGSKGSARSSSPAEAAASASKSNANSYRRSAQKRQASTPAPNPAAARPGNHSICGPWTCNSCTFDNFERIHSTATCALCGSSRTLSEEPEAATTMAAVATQQETTVSL